MKAEDLSEFFEKYDDEFLNFEMVEMKLSSRPDLHAFLLLNRLSPDTDDMVAGAEHDEIYLSVDAQIVAAAATLQELIDLHRCGVRYSRELNCLVMFV